MPLPIPTFLTDGELVDLRDDAWLGEVLEVPCYRAVQFDGGMNADKVRERMLSKADGKSAFFFAKIPTAEIGFVTTLTRAGFDVTDVNVTLDWADENGLSGADVGDVEIGRASETDSLEIENVAGRCFAYSRFHLDPLISTTQANEVKRQWARNACRGRAATVYAARRGGELAGFLAVATSDAGGAKDAIIDLIGVDAGHQGRGVGRSLSRAFIGDWRSKADRLRVGTQISNIPALRLYESLGFRLSETSYVLHAHIRDGVFCA